MSSPGASGALVGHVALLAIISFGGVPGVLPDLRDFVVDANGWLTDREFANCFAVVQAIPGPNMILMMSFIGWKLGGLFAKPFHQPAQNLSLSHADFIAVGIKVVMAGLPDLHSHYRRLFHG